MEEAVECYQRAANMFKMAKKWGAAGNAFCEAANLHAKTGSKHDVATNYVDAANCYKKSDPNGRDNEYSIGSLRNVILNLLRLEMDRWLV